MTNPEIVPRIVSDSRFSEQRRPAVRAALYVRVSSQAQAEKFSLPSQRRILQDMADERGWQARLYDEGGVSAETIEARPVMRQLLDDIEAGLVDAVAVIEMERLCRASDLRDWARISSTCRKAGVLVHTPERVFNLQAAEDDFEADLRGILSKREKRKLLERTARGMAEAKDAGRYIGGSPPTGYKYDPYSRSLVPDPEMAPVVQRIFRSPLSAWQMARDLQEDGISLHYLTIRHIRENPAYIGLRPNTRGELIQADWPAIIDEKTWEHQKHRPVRARRRSPRRDRGSAYLLSGMLRCTCCDGPMIGTPIRDARDGTALFVYKCRNRECPGRRRQITGWAVDRAVVEALTRYASDPEALKARFREAARVAADPNRAHRRAELESTLTDIATRQQRLLEAVETGTLPNHVVRQRLTAIQTEEREAQLELDLLFAAEHVPSVPDMREILELAAQLPERDREIQRKLLEKLAARVEVDCGEREVTVRWQTGGEERMSVKREHHQERLTPQV